MDTIIEHNPRRFAANAPVCLTCAGSRRGCPIDGAPISTHADVGYCPSGKFKENQPKPEAWESLPTITEKVAHGAIGIGRVVRSLLARPAQLPGLFALAADAAAARRALTARVRQIRRAAAAQ